MHGFLLQVREMLVMLEAEDQAVMVVVQVLTVDLVVEAIGLMDLEMLILEEAEEVIKIQLLDLVDQEWL